MKLLLAILIIISLAGCAPDKDDEVSIARGTFDRYEFTRGWTVICFEDGRYYWICNTEIIVSKGDSVEVYNPDYGDIKRARLIPEWRKFTDEEKDSSLNAKCSTGVIIFIPLEEK